MRRIFILLLAAAIVTCGIPTVRAADSELIIDRISISDTGETEIIGHVTNAIVDVTQVTCLINTDDYDYDYKSFTNEKILYVDQTAVGNNGTFLFTCTVRPIFSERNIVLGFNTPEAAPEATREYRTLPKLPPDIECVADNSVLYGADTYKMDSVFLDPKYVTNSIVSGGNVIYFKIGGNWYNLLDSRATSNAFLVPENATSIIKMKDIPVRYYYTEAEKIEFMK